VGRRTVPATLKYVGWGPSQARSELELAEGEGFEPPVRFPVQWFSRPPPSTTRPSLRVEHQARIRASHRPPRRETRLCHRKCNGRDKTRRPRTVDRIIVACSLQCATP